MVTSQVDECHRGEATVNLSGQNTSSSKVYFEIIKVNKHFSATISTSHASNKLLIAGNPGVSTDTLLSPDWIKQDPCY